MADIKVNIQYWRYDISSDLLTRYGSPYHSIKDAAQAVWANLTKNAVKIQDENFDVEISQVISGNEAFPESALADPIADLELWEEWASGKRVFPYPGKFSRLGVTKQESKTAAPSSIGVVGEIFAGLFSQAVVSQNILVRSIRKWPDFIYYCGGDLYSFVESKAFTNATLAKTLKDRIPGQVTKEVLYDSVHQLNADPHLDVWGVFTGLVSVSPIFQFTVTAIQITPPSSLRSSRPRLNLPDVVVKGLVERAVAQAAFNIPRFEIKEKPSSNYKKELKEYLKDLIEASKGEIESLLVDSASNHAIEASRFQIEKELKRITGASLLKEDKIGKTFFSIKQNNEDDVLRRIRKYGPEFVFMADLGSRFFNNLKASWNSDIRLFNQPSFHVAGFPIWQCGGSLYAVGPKELENRRITII